MLDNQPRIIPCYFCAGKGTVQIPSELKCVETYYFGCIGNSGHYWFSTQGEYISRINMQSIMPDYIYNNIDTGFCFGSMPSGSYGKSQSEIVGEAVLTQIQGWTILSWWDRSVDSHPGSNSNIVAKGEHDYNTIMEIAKAHFPKVMDRQKLELKLVKFVIDNREVNLNK